jgi:hypothetical protein
MNATTEVLAGTSRQNDRTAASPLRTRLRTRLHRNRLDVELAKGADPNGETLRARRARQLTSEETRQRIAASLERLLAEADEAPRPFSSKVPIARAQIRDCRWDIEGLVERLKAPTYICPQAVAMANLLIHDGAGPLYGNHYSASFLRWKLVAIADAIDNGPVMVAV